MHSKKVAILSLLIVLLVTFSGCAGKTGSWGSEATLTPGWDHIGHAAVQAVSDPMTWAPIGAALLFRVDNFDRRTVDWASDQNPLFNTSKHAEAVSDTLQQVSKINYLLTVAVVPSEAGFEGIKDKAFGLGLGWVAISATGLATSSMKSTFNRERPDESNFRSFPSGHASSSAVAATLAVKNIDHMPLGDTEKKVWQWSSYAVAGLTGWARVEAERHYPSDVLSGFALGHFIGSFINGAFIAPEYQGCVAVRIDEVSHRNIAMSLSYRW
jgi:membrane-associated phospholipid phosphatase